jgi:hypothetical protein
VRPRLAAEEDLATARVALGVVFFDDGADDGKRGVRLVVEDEDRLHRSRIAVSQCGARVLVGFGVELLHRADHADRGIVVEARRRRTRGQCGAQMAVVEHADRGEHEARGCPQPIEKHQRRSLGSTPESGWTRTVTSNSNLS